MSPMEPLPETLEALNEIDPGVDEDLLGQLLDLANRAREIVPDLVGVSVARLADNVTFTLVASDADIAVLDAIQYAAGGPCVDAAHAGQVREFNDDDILDEERWQIFAEATAAHTVRSTLTLPVVADGRTVGTVNLYAASTRAFVEHHEALAQVFGAWAAGAVANADLSFTTRRQARATPERLRERGMIDVAVGILAATFDVDFDAAEARLRTAATYAGVTIAQLAKDIVRAHGDQGRHED
jgi:GAF domain-containing protein